MNEAVADHVDRTVNGRLNQAADRVEARRRKMEMRWAAKRMKMQERWARWQRKHGWADANAPQPVVQPEAQNNQTQPTPPALRWAIRFPRPSTAH